MNRMASSRKPEQDGLAAQPDGTVHWSKAMRDALATFDSTPCSQCGGTLSGERGLAADLACFTHRTFATWQQRPARLRMLELHGVQAADLFFSPDLRKETLADLMAIHDAAVVRFLVGQVRQPEAKSALARLAARWPLCVLQALLSANPARHQAGAALVLELLAAHPEWQAPLEVVCDADQRKTLVRLQDTDSAGLTDAAPTQWPAFLQRPPWTHRPSLPAVPTLALAPQAQPPALHWAHFVPEPHLVGAGEAGWLDREVDDCRARCAWSLQNFAQRQPAAPDAVQSGSDAHKALWLLGLRPERIDAALHGDDIAAQDFGDLPPGMWGRAELLWALPAALAPAVFQHTPALAQDLGSAAAFRPILYRFGAPALPGLLRHLKQGSRGMFALVSHIEWDRLADWVAKGFHSNRWVRDEATDWLRRYPGTAARGLLPSAFAEPGPARDAAQAAVRWLHVHGHADALRQQAEARGGEVVDALTRLLAIAPEDVLPDSLPALPKSLPLASLPRLVLKDSGHALPPSVLPDVLMTMMLSKAEAPYPALGVLQAVLTPDSLARLGRALLAWWTGNGRPAKERWMFALQGLQPVLHDSAGKLLKALPKATASDDASLAAAATTQLKDLRKLAKTVAGTQLQRLESAMCGQRRWTVDAFMPLLAQHPVMRVFSRQLVWGVFDAAMRLTHTFRVSAEGELRDRNDDALVLPAAAQIGLPHALELAACDPALSAAWTTALADYEVLQPFEQLARATFALDPALRDQRTLVHWAGRTVSNAGLLGLESQGWQRAVGDGGMVDRFRKPVADGQHMDLWLEDGWFVQDRPDATTLHTVRAVVLDGPGATLGGVTPIALSEIERDLHRVVRPAF